MNFKGYLNQRRENFMFVEREKNIQKVCIIQQFIGFRFHNLFMMIVSTIAHFHRLDIVQFCFVTTLYGLWTVFSKQWLKCQKLDSLTHLWQQLQLESNLIFIWIYLKINFFSSLIEMHTMNWLVAKLHPQHISADGCHCTPFQSV